MATRTISTKLQLDGEAEYRASLKNINSELGTLKSELKLTESQFAGHLNSYAALSAKGETLAGMYDQQEKKLAAINKILSEAKDAQSKFGNEVQSAKDKIAKTEAALNALADAEGDTSEQQAKLTAELEKYKTELATAEANQQKATEAVNKYQTQANSAEAELNKLGNEIDENNKCMDEAAKSSDKCADSVDKYSGKVKKADEDTEKFSEKLKTGLVAGATAAAAAFAAISAAAVKLGVEVVTAYADYEQLVGGVETLFQDSSGKVLDYANNAYKTAGLSANEYMETVTSFSASLLSSLGGDTEKAADYADKAITDMSDNANKMGSDMDSIMNAYKGFSKQTFTMLDNLKLGYGGTKEEMQRLLDDAEKISGIKYDISSYADIVDAIHVIQTEMGITGTTAKEAEETISGSIGMLKTSFQNLITGMGDADANIDQLCDNVVNSFKSVVKNISPVIQNLAKTIPNAMEGILDAISPLIPEFLELGVNLFEALLNGIIDMLPELSSTAAELITTLITGIVEALPLVVEAAAQLLTALVEGIGAALPTLIPAAVEAVTQLVQSLIDNIPLLIEAALQLVTGLAEGIIEAIPVLLEALPELIESLISALLEAVPQIIETGVTLLTALVTNLPTIIQTIIAVLPQIITSVIQTLLTHLPEIIDAGFKLLTALIDNLPEIILTIVEALPEIISAIIKALTDNIPVVVETGVKLLTSLITNLPQIIAEIVRAMPEIITGIVNALSEGISQVTEVGANLVRGLWNGIQSLAGWLWDQVSSWISGIWDGIKDFFGIASPSKQMAWVGSMLVEGLAGAIDKDGDKAVAAVDDMAAGMIAEVESEMAKVNASLADGIGDIETGFTARATIQEVAASIPASLNAGRMGAGAIAGGETTVTNHFHIAALQVREEADVKKVAKELYNMQKTKTRSKGVVT